MAQITVQHPSVLEPTAKELHMSAAQTWEERNKASKSAIKDEITIPEVLPIKERIGKIGLMWPRTYALNHPAAPLLDRYALKGCPVGCGDHWTQDRIEAAIAHGLHCSVCTPQAQQALRQEALEKVNQGFAKIVRYGEIKSNLPAQLKISPAACISHKSRKYWVILDLLFCPQHNEDYTESVNDTTIPQAPTEAMGQLRSCFRHLVATMANNYSSQHPFRFANLDVKDRVWCMVVSPANAWNFCYVLPSVNGKRTPLEDSKLIVPDALQMGWCESPPFFCTVSETARDAIQNLLKQEDHLPLHKFESKMIPESLTETKPHHPFTILEVFVDDFIAGTNQPEKSHLQTLSQCMLHGVHSIFPPSEVTNHGGGDSVAQEKLNQEEGQWQEVKEILGWTINGADYTIQLPPDKVDIIINWL